MQSADVSKLQYASPGLAEPRLFSRNLIRILLIVLLVAGVLRFGPRLPGLYKNWMRLRIQEKCLRYTAPPTQVVYEEDPAAAASLLKQSNEYLAVMPLRSLSDLQSYVTGNPLPSVSPVTILLPQCWKEFDRVTSPNAVLFLHELRGPTPRLVCVELIGSKLEVNLRRPDPALISVEFWKFHSVPLNRIRPGNIRFHAGQVDPADPSAFTIRYTFNGKDGFILGKLNSSYNKIDFQFPAQEPWQ